MGSDKRPRREDPAANGTALNKVIDKWRNTAPLNDADNRALDLGYDELAQVYSHIHDAPEAVERRRRYGLLSYGEDDA